MAAAAFTGDLTIYWEREIWQFTAEGKLDLQTCHRFSLQESESCQSRNMFRKWISRLLRQVEVVGCCNHPEAWPAKESLGITGMLSHRHSHTHWIACKSTTVKKQEGSLYGVPRRRFIPATCEGVQGQRQGTGEGPGFIIWGVTGVELRTGSNG